MCAVLECFPSLFEAAAHHGKHQDVTAVLSLVLKVVRPCLSSQERQQQRCTPKKYEEIFGRKRTARGGPVNPCPAHGGQDLLQVTGQGQHCSRQVPASSSSGKQGQPMPGQRPCSGALLGEPRLECAARTAPEPPEQHHRNNAPSHTATGLKVQFYFNRCLKHTTCYTAPLMLRPSSHFPATAAPSNLPSSDVSGVRPQAAVGISISK